MKVCELIKELKQWRGDEEVFIMRSSNDEYNSVIASEVCFTQNAEIVWSNYYDCYIKINGENSDKDAKIIDVIELV